MLAILGGPHFFRRVHSSNVVIRHSLPNLGEARRNRVNY